MSVSSDSKALDQSKANIDWVIFAASLVVVASLIVPIIAAPEQTNQAVIGIYDFIATYLGIFYQWGTILCLIFLVWLGASKHGLIRLGRDDTAPEFSGLSWFGMLFCAGVGAGLLYWATIEWSFYATTPPFSVEPNSPDALKWAPAYGLFHWGIAAWAIYALPAVAIALPYYRLNLPHLRLSTAFTSLIGSQNSYGARLLDLFFIIALLAGAGTSMGLAIPMVAACFSQLTGLETGFALSAALIFLCVLIFGGSVFLGLDRGIKRLSDINVYIAFIFLLFIIVFGPTQFLLRQSTEALGFMASNFVAMLTYTDPIARTRFVEDWTIFYWAWWFAFAPFVGLFIARISRGRTLRQLIFSMLFFGSAGAWAFFFVVGNYSMWLDLNGVVPVRQLTASDPAMAIAAVIGALPFAEVALSLFIFMSIIFIATTYDSASYALAAAASDELTAGQNPTRIHRLFWAVITGLTPACLLFLEGGLKSIMSVVLIASLPILIICVGMVWAIMKNLRTDHAL